MDHTPAYYLRKRQHILYGAGILTLLFCAFTFYILLIILGFATLDGAQPPSLQRIQLLGAGTLLVVLGIGCLPLLLWKRSIKRMPKP